jgi:hypothetical protein
MNILPKLLGGIGRVKLMRLFLLNKNMAFSFKEIEKRSLVNNELIKKELKLLRDTSFIKKKKEGYCFNKAFPYQREFEDLLVSSNAVDKETIATLFRKVGTVKLLLVSGVFIKDKDSRVDLLIVGNKMNKAKIRESVRKVESLIGKEITYAVFDYKEFIYRLNMYDKLIRDIIDFPHKVIIQTKELSTQILKKK